MHVSKDRSKELYEGRKLGKKVEWKNTRTESREYKRKKGKKETNDERR